MAIKLERCFGCKACVIACKSENYAQFASPDEIVEQDPVFWVRVHSEFSGSYPEFRARYYPLICRHCENPLCQEACPSEAISRRQDGIVIINQENCNGCDACIPACPYQIPQHNNKTDKAEMCNFCVHRVGDGKEPMCVIACPSKALVFGDLNDRESEVSSLVASKKALKSPSDLTALPSVYLLDSSQ